MRQQPPSDDSDDGQQRLAEIQRDMEEMRSLVRQLMGASAVENVLINGFSKLSAQLEPLAELTPPRRTPMQRKDMARLAKVREELKRVDWTGAASLELPHRQYDDTYIDRELEG